MIEQFVAQSIGEWRSMRSGHSLAFKQFEEVISTIQIKPLNDQKPIVKETIKKSLFPKGVAICPFSMEWLSESNWLDNNNNQEMSGSCILIPLNVKGNEGFILRSKGYAEPISAISEFIFLSDGTLKLNTNYDETSAEERIWFLSENVRCRSSVIRSIESKAILQTSFASEIRIINKNELKDEKK